MRRNIIFSAAIGMAVAAVVSLAHGLGWLGVAESPLRDWMLRAEVPPRVIGNVWQTIFVTLVSLGVTWLTLTAARRHRVAWLVLGFAAEMLVLVWVCALFHLFFQPLPCILAAAFAYAAGIGYLVWQARPPRPRKPVKPKPEPRAKPEVPAVEAAAAAVSPAVRPETKPEIKPVFKMPLPKRLIAKEPPPPKLPPKPQPVPAPVAPIRQAEPIRPVETLAGAPALFEVTVLVCDLVDKYNLVDDSEPVAGARDHSRFTQRASDLVQKAGAHLHKADGEGVVAIFGFPQSVADSAEQAVRVGFDLLRSFSSGAHGSNGDNAANSGVHIGVSSGDIIAGRNEGNPFVLGEAVELARRFCVANRFYGSRILVGPQTFELASSAVVARPIDFLTGVTAQERHEIYEPLALAADASPDLLARRDSFWNGVVLYREKRWVEALSEFQKARSGPDEDDPPLNLYLRRLEPLALAFIDSGRE